VEGGLGCGSFACKYFFFFLLYIENTKITLVRVVRDSHTWEDTDILTHTLPHCHLASASIQSVNQRRILRPEERREPTD